MVAASTLSHLPPQLVEACRQEAERDAIRVAAFLDGFLAHLAPVVRPDLQFPAWFLVALGSGLRLWYWEDHGIMVHLDEGLPGGRDVVRDAFLGLNQPDPERTTRVVTLACDVMTVFANHFAWLARAEMGADFLLGPADEDAFIDALAEFVWKHRSRATSIGVACEREQHDQA
jgi:hypothetical protein